MTSTGLETFDRTVKEANIWLKQIMTEMHTDDRHQAYTMLRVTLHTLRDRLTREMAVHFGAQLPILLRGVMFENWHMAGTPTKHHDAKAFLDQMRHELPDGLVDEAEFGCRAVFKTIADHIDRGQVDKIKSALPGSIRDLWLSEAA